MDYYKVISCKDDVDHKIKWNILDISGDKFATGFVIQHMKIKSNISTTKNEEYWEAWAVNNGQIDGSDDLYDDNWSPIPSYLVSECRTEIQDSKDGTVCYESDVYWIPSGSEVYEEISLWKSVDGSPAGDLATSKEFLHIRDAFYICSRHHQWNYKEILQKLTKSE